MSVEEQILGVGGQQLGITGIQRQGSFEIPSCALPIPGASITKISPTDVAQSQVRGQRDRLFDRGQRLLNLLCALRLAWGQIRTPGLCDGERRVSISVARIER